MQVDRQLVNKQIAATKLKQKVIISSALLLVAIVAWAVIQFLLPKPEIIDQEILDLAKPFSFQINQSVLGLLTDKIQFTDEQMTNFPIYIIDESSLSRGNSLVVNQLGTGGGIMQVQEETPPATEINFDEEVFFEYMEPYQGEAAPDEIYETPPLDQDAPIY